MTLLHDKTCTACRIGAPQLTEQELSDGLATLPDWSIAQVSDVRQLTRRYKFKNFIAALEFTHVLGALAEEFNHHPAILTEWGKVTVAWWTHKINGIHENDLIMAAKTEQLFQKVFATPT